MPSHEPALTYSFKNKKIKIYKMKTPFFKKDKNGIFIASGYICFSVDNGDNSFSEHYTKCTSKVLQEVTSKKLYKVNNIDIYLTFDKDSVATDIEIQPNFKDDLSYGFKMDPRDKANIEQSILDIGTKMPSGKEVEDCIIRVLSSPNEDGVFAEITFIPKHAQRNNVSEILREISEKVENKQEINVRDLICGKYIVTSINNNGEYIYINPNSI